MTDKIIIREQVRGLALTNQAHGLNRTQQGIQLVTPPVLGPMILFNTTLVFFDHTFSGFPTPGFEG